jgi:hypothetical protein
MQDLRRFTLVGGLIVLAVLGGYFWLSAVFPGSGTRVEHRVGETSSAPAPAQGETGTTASQPQFRNQVLVAASATVAALKVRNLEALALLVHPTKGVRFSPYTSVNLKTDLVFQSDQLAKIFASDAVLTWGEYETQEAIRLTFADYLSSFTYAHDFANAPEVSYNTFLRGSTKINNIPEIYPEAVFVEYHFPGFNPRFGGADWQSLRLVFERLSDQWFVVGIVNDRQSM